MNLKRKQLSNGEDNLWENWYFSSKLINQDLFEWISLLSFKQKLKITFRNWKSFTYFDAMSLFVIWSIIFHSLALETDKLLKNGRGTQDQKVFFGNTNKFWASNKTNILITSRSWKDPRFSLKISQDEKTGCFIPLRNLKVQGSHSSVAYFYFIWTLYIPERKLFSLQKIDFN